MALLTRTSRAIAAAALLGACGGGGASGGGSEHLPTLGAGPYGKVPVRLVSDLTADLEDPTVLETEGGYRIWFTRTAHDGTEPEIWTAELTSLDEPASGLAPALVADRAWEEGAARAPCALRLGDGRLALYYQGGTSVGRAVSVDEGATWIKEDPLYADATDPAALAVDDRILLYHGRPGQDAVYLDDLPDPVLSGVSQPSAVGGRSAVGQMQIGIFYVQPWEDRVAIGYAGSRDGRSFLPFFEGAPVLDPLSPEERGPSAILHSDRGVLFFSEPRGPARAIGAAVHP
jgi:hypothetical protein